MIVPDVELVLRSSERSIESRAPGELVEAIFHIAAHRLTFSLMSIVAFDDVGGLWRASVRLDGEGKPVLNMPGFGTISPQLRRLAARSSRRAVVVDDYRSGAPEDIAFSGTNGMRSGVHVFLQNNGSMAGTMFIQHVEPGVYSERDGSFVYTLGHAARLILNHFADSAAPYGTGATPARLRADETSSESAADRSTRLVGSSAAMRSVGELIDQVAATELSVLILGETGTGKDLIASKIFEKSNRFGDAFIAVNCAALAPELVASELFGHVAGAFTGATSQRKGRFELANRGTLFLDEVGDLPWETQVQLLRVLENGEIQRVGSNTTVETDVRIVAATHRDLEKLVADGLFRRDLFYRLNVFPIQVPPLRDRGDDCAELARHFVRLGAIRARRPAPSISAEALDALKRFPWLGNVRELRNVVERAMILADYGPIGVEQLPDVIVTREPAESRPNDERSPLVERQLPIEQAVRSDADVQEILTFDEVARMHILKALDRCGGKVSGKGGAAELLRINTKTLESRMRRYGIRRRWM